MRTGVPADNLGLVECLGIIRTLSRVNQDRLPTEVRQEQGPLRRNIVVCIFANSTHMRNIQELSGG